MSSEAQEMTTEGIKTLPMALDQLSNMPLCAELTEDQCHAFAEKMSLLEVIQGTCLIEEGHVDHRLYIVLSGRLEVKKRTANDDWLTLTVLNRGAMVGQSGFIDGTPHTAQICALDNALLFALERSELESFLETDPLLVYRVMRSIVRSTHRIISKMNSMHVELNNYIHHSHGRY